MGFFRCSLLFSNHWLRTHRSRGLFTSALCSCACSHHPAPFLLPAFPLSFPWLLLSLFILLFSSLPSFCSFPPSFSSSLSPPSLCLSPSFFFLSSFLFPPPPFTNHSFNNNPFMHQAVWNEGEKAIRTVSRNSQFSRRHGRIKQHIPNYKRIDGSVW